MNTDLSRQIPTNLPGEIEALIFDFNGVICDDEKIHFEVLQQILAEEGIKMNGEEYYSLFLGRDDRECFRLAFERSQKEVRFDLNLLIRRKSLYYLRRVQQSPPVFPGVVPLIKEASKRLSLAVASGALRSEVDFVLERLGVLHCFQAIVTSEDVSQGKPSPEIFLEALKRINDRTFATCAIGPERCLVIEDSVPGIDASLAAGMKCLAVTNSHSKQQLARAHRRLSHLDLPLSDLLALFGS